VSKRDNINDCSVLITLAELLVKMAIIKTPPSFR
jgi:hypothetical protein